MSSPVVGLLGGGQLGRMIVEAANRLDIRVNVLDAADSPAAQISSHDGHVVGSFNNREDVMELAKSCDILTAEIEHVDTYALEASHVLVEPSWKSIRIIQDKFLQKEHLSQFGIPMPEYRELKESTEEALATIGDELGYPFMLKSKTLAYDGRGNYPVRSKKDIPSALKALHDRPLYAEKWANFKMEIAVMVVKTKDGVFSFPTVETVQENSICKLVYAPPRNVSDVVSRKAQKLARDAVAAFDGKGAFGVEMFLLEDDSLLLCELASRVHNSGHFTIEACGISQFEAHLRAILDLPLPPQSLELQRPAVMLNILGGPAPDSHLKAFAFALSLPNASIHNYCKGQARKGRKMGHVTITASTLQKAELAMQPLLKLTDKLNGISSSNHSTAKPQAVVGVVMGSDSDLKTLVPGLKLLEDYFGIIPEVKITSAHRTPEFMAEYATNAASRGIKAIIAAAGGAAHLPGMVAAYTTLPVIGIPVKASVLDGQDSLYSIVQMPRGVPVATVGISNSINAALLAARIIGAFDPEIASKVAQYAQNAKDENLVLKGKKMEKLGWRAYHDQMS